MGFVSMKITVTVLPESLKKQCEIQSGSAIIEVLKILKIKPDSSIVLHNNNPIPVDAPVDDYPDLKVLRVASGG